MDSATATRKSSGVRVLIYSHDSFGLGHLRRCRALAHDLVREHEGLSALILSGSPIIGSFDFRSRVDFVRIPGVIKLRNGDYTSLNLHIDIEETVAMRASIIRHTAEIFNPDLFIVDKEPLGLRGEVRETLEMLKSRGTPCILGLRDVLDEPALLAPEWERKNALPALQNLYDQIWVYGLPQIHDPLSGIDLPQSVRQKIVFTGYLKRTVPAQPPVASTYTARWSDYLLVTAGGGGDGDAVFDWVLKAYEADPAMPYPALLILGPFMQSERQAEYLERAAKLPNVEAITFEARMESLMERAIGVVGMGGYNTFCEILSFNKRALIVPRTVPRLEQYIRASRAQSLGLVAMLEDDNVHDPRTMITALRHLPQQRRPSDVIVPGLLDGLDNVNRLVTLLLNRKRRPGNGPATRQRVALTP